MIAVLFQLWRLLPLLRPYVNICVALTVMPYTVLGQPHLLGLSAALTIIGLDLLANVGITVSYLFLVGVCSAFYCSGLVLAICLLLLVAFLGTNMLQGLTGYVHCGGVVVADELHMIHECPVLQPLRLQYAALFTPDTNTMRSFFAQQDHMQVFKFVLDCLDFLKL